MEFVCPVCKSAGNIPEDDLDQPLKRTECRDCGTRLSIERKTGRVDTLPSAQDPRAGGRQRESRLMDQASSVLSMRPQEKGKRDYPAIAIFAVVLGVLIAAGVYFTLNIDRGTLDKPFQQVSKLIDDVSRYGKTIIGEFQKVLPPQNRQTRTAQPHVRKGYDHYKANRLNNARDELAKAIEINPQNPEAYYWRAQTFVKMGEFDDAIMDLKKVVDLNPRYVPAYDNLGWLYMRRNQFDEGLSYLNRSIELKPDNGWAYYLRSRIFFNKGDLQKALESAKTACDLDFKDGCQDAKRYESKLKQNG